MRPLRYSINVTLDGCCDHRAIVPDEDLHRHAVENFDRADALLFGRVTYQMMEAAFRSPARTGARPDWMEHFARTIRDPFLTSICGAVNQRDRIPGRLVVRDLSDDGSTSFQATTMSWRRSMRFIGSTCDALGN